jgi:hypothetical protein
MGDVLMFAGLFLAIRGFLSAIPPTVWAIAAGLAVVVGGGIYYGSARYDAGVLADRARSDRVLAEYVAEIEAARKQAAADKLAAEARERAAYDEVSTRLEKEKADDRKKSDALIADLRAGNVRLQRRFQCPANATAGLPEAADSAGQRHDADGSGFTDADAEIAFGIAAAGDEAIRQLTACQDIVRARQ